MATLAFDPDTATTAWALVDGCKLLDCGLIVSDQKVWGDDRTADQMRAILRVAPTLPYDQADMVVIEDQHNRRKGVSIKNIFKVAHIAGALRIASLGHHTAVNMLSPEVWTQGWSKDARIQRVPRLLNTTMEEIARMAGCSVALANHVNDAAGIAHWVEKNKERPSVDFRRTPRRRRRR